MVDPLLQRPLRVRYCFRTAPELHLPTDVVALSIAVLATLARQSDFERHAVTSLQVRHRGADGGDETAGLVAKGQRLTDNDVAVAVVIVVVQVGAAETGGLNSDLDFVGGRSRKLSRFLCVVSAVYYVCWQRELTMCRSFAPWSTEALT